MSRKRFFRFPFGKAQVAEDVRTELEHHLALTEESLKRDGLNTDAARAEARRRFGDRDRVAAQLLQEAERRRTRLEWRHLWNDLGQDLQYAVRALSRDRAFTLTAFLILALGIGATTALFSLYRGTVLQPLNTREPDRLVLIELVEPDRQGDNVTPAAWFEWKDRARSLAGLAWVGPGSVTLEAQGNPEQINGIGLSQDALAVLDIHPAIGRPFQAGDFEGAGQDVVLISDQLWQRRFNGDPHLLGQTILLDGRAEMVIGVLPADLDVFGARLDYWLPKTLPLSQRANRGTRYLTAYGRLAKGSSIESAQAELQTLLAPTLPPGDPFATQWRVRLTPLGQVYSAQFRDRLLLLLGAGLAVLLIGCANIGNLLLARGAGRRQEIAVRTALGASRWRIVRPLLTENLLLSLLAAAGGLLVAHWTLHGLIGILPSDIPRLDRVHIDRSAAGFAMGLAVIVALAVGLAPALRAARIDIRSVLGDGGRGATHGLPGESMRRALVVGEVALSGALLVSVALLLRSALALSRIPPGFVTDSVVTARMALPSRNYPTGENVSAAYQRIYRTVRTTPGPRAVAMISQVPLSDGGFGARFHQLEHAMTGTDGVLSNIRIASPGYFGVMGISLVGGRDFAENDEAPSPPVVIVNETFVREMGWTGSPVGRLVHTEIKDIGTRAGKEVAFEVVGVVKDVQEWGLRQAPSAILYLPITQAPPAPWEWTGREMEIAARANGDPLALVPALGAAVRQAEPGIPLYDVQTMGQRLRGSLALERTNTIVITALGILALLLAAVGIYGVLAYGVRQRAGEIGIRMALGAENRDIVRLVLGEGVRLALIGMVLGLPVAYGIAHLLQSSLFGVGTTDPLSFGGAGALLLVTTIAACLVPVKTALAVPPVDVLRS